MQEWSGQSAKGRPFLTVSSCWSQQYYFAFTCCWICMQTCWHVWRQPPCWLWRHWQGAVHLCDGVGHVLVWYPHVQNLLVPVLQRVPVRLVYTWNKMNTGVLYITRSVNDHSINWVMLLFKHPSTIMCQNTRWDGLTENFTSISHKVSHIVT